MELKKNKRIHENDDSYNKKQKQDCKEESEDPIAYQRRYELFRSVILNKDLLKYICSFQKGKKYNDINNGDWIYENGFNSLYLEKLRLERYTRNNIRQLNGKDEVIKNPKAIELQQNELPKHKLIFTSNSFYYAAKRNDLRMLKNLYQYTGYKCLSIQCLPIYVIDDTSKNDGAMEVIKYLIEKRNVSFSGHAITNAAKRGDLEMVKYLYLKSDYEFWEEPLKRAAANGHTNVVEFILARVIKMYGHDYLQNSINTVNEDNTAIEIVHTISKSLRKALKNKKYDTFDFIFNIIFGIEKDWGNNMFYFENMHLLLDDVAKSGNQQLFIKLSTHDPPFKHSINAMTSAIGNNHINIFEKLVNMYNESGGYNAVHLCDSICNGVIEAAKNGYIDAVKWAHSKIKSGAEAYTLFPMQSCMEQAIRNQRFAIVKWLHENTDICQWVNDMHDKDSLLSVDKYLNIAAKTGNLEIFSFLYEAGYILDINKVSKTAAAFNHINILKYLKETKKQYISNIALHYALSVKRIFYDTVRWLYYNTTQIIDHSTVALLIKNGFFDTVKEINKTGFRFEEENQQNWLEDKLIRCANNGHTNILEWFYSNGYKSSFSSTIILNAAKHRKHETVIWFLDTIYSNYDIKIEKERRYKNEIDQELLYSAFQSGDYYLVLSVIDYDFIMTKEQVIQMIDKHSKSGNLDLLILLHDKFKDLVGEKFWSGVYSNALNNYHLHILDWLHICDRGRICFICIKNSLESTYNVEHILLWLRQNRTNASICEGCILDKKD
jgi:hypothetical protein